MLGIFRVFNHFSIDIPFTCKQRTLTFKTPIVKEASFAYLYNIVICLSYSCERVVNVLTPLGDYGTNLHYYINV